jgi:hypothetical protein
MLERLHRMEEMKVRVLRLLLESYSSSAETVILFSDPVRRLRGGRIRRAAQQVPKVPKLRG